MEANIGVLLGSDAKLELAETGLIEVTESLPINSYKRLEICKKNYLIIRQNRRSSKKQLTLEW